MLTTNAGWAADPSGETEDGGFASGERRQVTVLFCDLVGSTALSSRLDQEEMRHLLRDYQDACADAIAPFEGQIAQTMGDGLLVYFGYPLAHEDDAERALQAALAIVFSLTAVHGAARPRARSCAVRIGISTGLVVVGQVARSDTRANMALVGETPNIAARLQQLAEPNEILVSATTHRLIASRFSFDEPEWRELKGIDRPIAVYRLRGDTSPEDGGPRPAARFQLDLPLVGRAQELSVLAQLWAKASEGNTQVIAISGPPGIGKSGSFAKCRTRWIRAPSFSSDFRAHPIIRTHPIIR